MATSMVIINGMVASLTLIPSTMRTEQKISAKRVRINVAPGPTPIGSANRTDENPLEKRSNLLIPWGSIDTPNPRRRINAAMSALLEFFTTLEYSPQE